MSPAVAPDDHVIMEAITFLARRPRKGDIVAFKSDGIPSMLPNAVYISRVAGEPGERLRISEGKLYVNDKHLALRNKSGEIHYAFIPGCSYLASIDQVMTVPAGHYLVLGDNSTNSYDGRCWGPLPEKNVMGRIVVCYWPPDHIGGVR